MLEGAASGLISGGIQQAFTDYNRKEDFANYQQAQHSNFQMAQEMQMMSPQLTKLGMVAAGLNPAQMNNPTPAAVNSAPLGSHASPNVTLSQDNNLMADARLKNAEAEKTELQNEQIKGENEASFANYRTQMEQLVNAYESRGMTSIANNIKEELSVLNNLYENGKLKFNAGHLKGAVDAFSTAENMQQRISNTLSEILKTETNFRMLVNGSSVSLSKMPQLQKNLLASQIANNIATNAVLASQKDLNKEQINELVKLQSKQDAEINKLVADRQLTEYEAAQIRNADWKSLLKDGDFMSAVLAKSDEQQKIIMQQIGSIANAVVNARTGGKIAQSINNVGQSKGNQSVQTKSYHYDAKGKLKGHDVNTSTSNSTMLKRSIPWGADDVSW